MDEESRATSALPFQTEHIVERLKHQDTSLRQLLTTVSAISGTVQSQAVAAWHAHSAAQQAAAAAADARPKRTGGRCEPRRPSQHLGRHGSVTVRLSRLERRPRVEMEMSD